MVVANCQTSTNEGHNMSCITVNSQHQFLVLHPTGNSMPLQECIDALCTEEQLYDYTCEHCQSTEQMYNQMKIVSSPLVLFIQLGHLGHNNHVNFVPGMM